MTATVNPDICIGCTLCTQVCPEVFRMVEGKSVAYVASVPVPDEDDCKKAAQGCPVSAITITE